MRVTIRSRSGSHEDAVYTDVSAVEEYDDSQFPIRLRRHVERPVLVNTDYDRVILGGTDDHHAKKHLYLVCIDGAPDNLETPYKSGEITMRVAEAYKRANPDRTVTVQILLKEGEYDEDNVPFRGTKNLEE